jgi:hypothetical protein
MLWHFIPPATQATITLKNSVGPPGPPMKGEMIKKDRYVVFRHEDRQEMRVYNWEQLDSVVETPSSFTVAGRAVEWVELFSKVGACLAILIFILGLYQYAHGQKWEREKFLAGIVKDFRTSPKGQAAALMVDSLYVVSVRRPITLYPDKEGGGREKYVTHEMIYKALRVGRHKFTPDELAIRECFDVFFNYLESLDHYISTGLVKKRSVYRYSNYWIDLLGKEGGRLDIPAQTGEEGEVKVCRKVLLHYAHEYDFYGVQRLLNRYTKRYRMSTWVAETRLARWLAGFEPMKQLFSTTPLKFLTGSQNWPQTRRRAPAF